MLLPFGLAEVRGMPHKNLAAELLRKLLNDEVKSRSRQNLVQARSFADLLEKSVRRYQSRAIEAAQVIEELIGLAKEMRQAQARGEALGLTSDELAFYDALEINDSAVQVLGDATLRAIAREFVETVRRSADDRLDGERVRPGEAAGDREAGATEVRVPAGQAGGSDEHSASAGGAFWRICGRRTHTRERRKAQTAHGTGGNSLPTSSSTTPNGGMRTTSSSLKRPASAHRAAPPGAVADRLQHPRLRIDEPQVGKPGLQVEPRLDHAVMARVARRGHLAEPVGHDIDGASPTGR